MSKVKKILAMVLALAMIMGMTVTTFAGTNDNKITVSLPAGAEDATITASKIVEEDRTSTDGWKFVSQFQNAFVAGWLDKQEAAVTTEDVTTVIKQLIVAGMIENTNNNQYSIPGNINPNAALGRALANIKNSLAEASTVITPYSVTEGSDVRGLYAINVAKDGYTFTPMSVYVGTGFTGVTVTAKGAEDKVSKTVNGEDISVNEGDKVDYEVTVEYPFYSADVQNKTFTIKDTLTYGTFETDKNLKVYINDEEVTTGFEASVSQDKTELTITFDYDSTKAGQNVKITYTATAGKVTDENSMSNRVQSITSKGTEYVVISDTVKFEVTKTDDKTEKPLNGAEFTLYRRATDKEIADESVEKVELVYNYKEGTEDKSEEFLAIALETLATAGEGADAGKATFDGLDAQDEYFVKETKAPDGYSLNDNVYKLTGATVDGGTVSGPTKRTENGMEILTWTTTYVAKDFNPQTITDTKLNSLPSTGGIGTTIFTIGGCAIMIVAAGLFFASRRKESK